MPLAIELAAARVALFDPDELLARLDRRLPLLASHSRDAPARQRTLRSAIQWSDELLTSHEQDLFRRLAVFGGGFSLQSAEAVAAMVEAAGARGPSERRAVEKALARSQRSVRDVLQGARGRLEASQLARMSAVWDQLWKDLDRVLPVSTRARLQAAR